MRAHLEDNAGDALRADLLATVGGSVVVMCELFQATEARGAGQRVAELRRRERGLCDEPGLFLPIPGGWQMILLEVGLELPVLENVIHELWQLFGRRSGAPRPLRPRHGKEARGDSRCARPDPRARARLFPLLLLKAVRHVGLGECGGEQNSANRAPRLPLGEDLLALGVHNLPQRGLARPRHHAA